MTPLHLMDVVDRDNCCRKARHREANALLLPVLKEDLIDYLCFVDIPELCDGLTLIHYPP